MKKTLEYYFEDGTHVKFDKYTIDTSGVVRNDKTEGIIRLRENRKGYRSAPVQDNLGISRGILIGRALVSTFHGKPPTLFHSADHIDRNHKNDILTNLRWACKKVQGNNRTKPTTKKDAFIVVNDGVEKNIKEWVNFLKDKKNHLGRKYTEPMINRYAQKKQHGFSYKEYPNFPGEIWKEIDCSKTTRGHWEISNMNRVKCITNHTENVLSGDRLGLLDGYPRIMVNGKQWTCHILSFKTFYPDVWENKKQDEFVLHENDDRLDFRPHKLRLGTHSHNRTDAYDNGCYDNTLSERQKCTSYIKGIFEKEHESQADAERYLVSLGFEKARSGGIGQALKAFRDGQTVIRYGRTWKLST